MARKKKKKRGKHKYRSGFECDIGDDLGKSEGVTWEYETERLPYTIRHVYTPDFILIGNGKKIYVESKGHFTAPDRTKTLAIIAQYPDIDLRLLFYRARNRLSARSKTTYSDWCDRHDITWAEGNAVPEDWKREVKDEC